MTISVFIMFGLPWIDATLVPNDAGMITAIALLFVVNPLYSTAVGMFAGKNIKTSWWFPAITAIFFLVENGYFLKYMNQHFYCIVDAILLLVLFQCSLVHMQRTESANFQFVELNQYP